MDRWYLMCSLKIPLLAAMGALLLILALPGQATQGEYFSVSGTVTDANWNPIQGALVTLFDNDFNRVTTQETTAAGYFSFQGVSVKSNLCNVRISYTDNTGVDHDIPGYYIPAQTAKGTIVLGPNMTHYDDYALPGSVPHPTPTPDPPTPTPAPSPTPEPSTGDSRRDALFFICGFLAGASAALLAFIIFLRPKPPAR